MDEKEFEKEPVEVETKVEYPDPMVVKDKALRDVVGGVNPVDQYILDKIKQESGK